MWIEAIFKNSKTLLKILILMNLLVFILFVIII